MISAAAAERAHRQAAADDFAQGGQVGRDFLQLLHAAAGEPEAGHDLVEDEHARRAPCRAPAGMAESRARAGSGPTLAG